MTAGTTGHGLRHERRFLLPALPRALADGTAALVEERYLAGTRLALRRLPADVLVWRRYPVRLAGWPCAVDVFAGDLSGLVLALAAFGSAGEVARFPAPVYAVAEVTGDDRFAEDELARAPGAAVARAVSEYGMLLR